MAETPSKQEKEWHISYELLFEILRREKNREDLQQLEPDFFGSVFDYLNTLYTELRQMHEEPNSDDEIEKIQLKIQNLKKMVRDLYSRREKKLVGLAVMRSRTQQSIVNTSLLLENEKRLFDALVVLLETHKGDQLGVLAGTVGGNAGNAGSVGNTGNVENSITATNKLPLNMSAGVEPSRSVPVALETFKISEPIPEVKPTVPSLVSVRFLSVVQKFVGPSLEIYGPYQEGDTAALPAVVASILIEKQKAERREIQDQDHPEPHHEENEQDERVTA